MQTSLSKEETVAKHHLLPGKYVKKVFFSGRVASMMFRQTVPVVVSLCLFLTSTTALSQGRVRLKDVNERLIRVENILDQSLLELLQQIRGLEREMREMRGELENQANQLSKLRSQSSQGNSGATEQRLADIEAQLRGLAGDAGGGAVILGVDDNNTESEVKSASEAETTAYQEAKGQLDNNQYTAAIASFEDFLTRYPDGALADNALYWQGEAMYAGRSFEDAIINFSVLIESFPESSKVADARLKIAFAHYEQERYADARNQLQRVVSIHPGRSAAELAQQRLAAMDAAGQ